MNIQRSTCFVVSSPFLNCTRTLNGIVVAQASSPAGSPRRPAGEVPSDSGTLSEPAVGTTALRTGSWKEKILDARKHRRLISLSSVAAGGEGRGEEALLRNPLPSRSAGGAREGLPSRTDNLFY